MSAPTLPAYIEAFMRNIDWGAVAERIAAVRADRGLPQEDPVDTSLPSLSIEELAAQLAKGDRVQSVDAPKILTSKAALEGERKQVTVLFADLKGSMELLADRDPGGAPASRPGPRAHDGGCSPLRGDREPVDG
jgi:hypothetical protein